MITQITPVNELKLMFLEFLLNQTDRVNDIGSESVLNGIAYGCAKIGQKVLVNQSIVEGHIFPDTAYGVYLDELAALRGVAPRFRASQSTTYIRLMGDYSTTYLAANTIFTSISGITFYLEDDVTIDENGFAYAKIRSNQSGSKANVDALSITQINPIPTGHIGCFNEYRAAGGRDDEDDELFRKRIKDSVNQLSRTTLSYIEQVFMKINPNVLRVYKRGVDSDGKLNLTVVSVNGQDFSTSEFNDILNQSAEYLSLSEVLRSETDYSLKLNNVDWYLIDVDFRVDIDPAYNIDEVRNNIQIQIQKLFDYRFWKNGDKVEWDDMAFAVKNVAGVRYVPDTHFYPNHDINIPQYRIPRIRGFIMRDLNGGIIDNNNEILSDYYFPNTIDDAYQASLLTTI